MHFSRLLSLASIAALGSSQNTSLPDSPEPVAPGLTFLYTSLVECQNGLYTGPEGPRGIRTAIPILGGNVTGPRIKGALSLPSPPYTLRQEHQQQLTHPKGEILNLGADWGITDPQTGIFSADTRYNLRTHDGANILLQTSGPAQPAGGLQLRVVFETGDRDYYWLNNVVAVGVLSPAEGGGDDTFMLRIDVWHVS